jgi:hypothetical protein
VSEVLHDGQQEPWRPWGRYEEIIVSVDAWGDPAVQQLIRDDLRDRLVTAGCDPDTVTVTAGLQFIEPLDAAEKLIRVWQVVAIGRDAP